MFALVCACEFTFGSLCKAAWHPCGRPLTFILSSYEVAHSSLFLSAEDRFEWMLLGVYGPNDHRDNEIYGLRLK